MPNITIKEAADLTGKSKRTIQRYISSGKLSYTDRSDGTRMLYDGEVMAIFGYKEVNVTTVTHDTSHNVTQPDQEQIASLIQSLQQAIIESQAPLLAQIAELTSKLDELTNRIELTPEPVVQEEEEELPAFLRKPHVPTAEKVPISKKTKMDLSGESSYMKIPIFGKD